MIIKKFDDTVLFNNMYEWNDHRNKWMSLIKCD